MSDAKPSADHPLAVAVRAVRRAVILVIGLTVVALGVVMIVTPGPALVVIPLGLAILAVEFVWARRALRWVKRRVEDAAARAAGKRHSQMAVNEQEEKEAGTANRCE